MDVISFNEASTANGRITKVIAEPDSNSGLVTVPSVIASGDIISIPAGRTLVHPNLQVDGTLNIDGTLFIPSGGSVSTTEVDADIITKGGVSVLTTNDVDATPTEGSNNPVSSNGVFDALALKAPLASPTFTGTVVLPSTTSIGTITHTELSYIDGVTSPIQAQLNGKAATNATDTVAGGLKVRLNGTVAYFTNNGNNA